MQGMIAAGDRHTAVAGRQILKKGGNAVDAAVAAAFVSFFSEIAMVHWGGSGLATLYDPHSGASQVYDFFSNMPGLGRPPATEQALDFFKKTIDFGATTQDFYIGRGSVAVPGALFGLCRLLSDHGTLPLRQVLSPALALARDGITLNEYQAATLKLLEAIFTHDESMRQIFSPGGHFIQAGAQLRLPDLAATIEALANEGADTLRHGRLGQAILADQAAHGGLLTQQDLDAYEVNISPSIVLPYRGHEILLPPPCSSGGVLIGFALKLLNRFDVPALTPGSADHLQLLFEVMAATTRARRHWELARRYLEPDEAAVRFLSDEFVADFATEVLQAMIKGRPSSVVHESQGPRNTTHISVVDARGMAVSLTTTAGESAGFIVPETGFILNNMLGEADLFPDGFHQQRPGERIFTMMAPAVVLRDGKTRLVTGSGGSLRIRSAILQTIMNVVDFNLPLTTAVNRSRVHLENQVLQCEHGTNAAAMDEIEELGYPVNRWPVKNMYFGGAHSVAWENDRWVAAGDTRRSGTTA